MELWALWALWARGLGGRYVVNDCMYSMPVRRLVCLTDTGKTSIKEDMHFFYSSKSE